MDEFEPMETPTPPPPRRRLPVWPFILAGVMMLVGAFIFAAVAIPISMPYYALSPGPVADVSDYVQVANPSTTTKGELMFLTVSLQEVNVVEWVAAKLDSHVDLAPRENIRPAGVSQEELRQQNINLMDQSKQDAKYVALTYLGYDVTYHGSGALVNSTIADSAADGVLQPGDIITAVDGEKVEFAKDAVDMISGRAPGDKLVLTVKRTDPAEPDKAEQIDISLVLGPYRFVDENGKVLDDPNRGMVGVMLQNADVQIDFPVDVEIDSRNIGGPSAGLMFTLEIIDELTPEDITHGHRIAGTGTINADGEVGPIGGIRQKTFGAINAGAEYLLTPSENYLDAVNAAGDDIKVVEVANIQDAMTFLNSLGAA